MKVVIVGGVAGGASAAARIRRLDERAQIIMIERSGYVSYAMDFWASLEHTIRYKKNLPINAEIETELKECADSSREWDSKMEHLLHILT